MTEMLSLCKENVFKQESMKVAYSDAVSKMVGRGVDPSVARDLAETVCVSMLALQKVEDFLKCYKKQ